MGRALAGSKDELRQKTNLLHKKTKTRNLRLKITIHARQRMSERNISELDVRSILKIGEVVKTGQNETGEYWNICGITDDGREIVIVINPENNFIRVTLITTWERQTKKIKNAT